MKRKLLSSLVLFLILSLLLSSCSSIYDAPPSVTTEPLLEVDESEEYFTTGYLYTKMTMLGGFVHGDSWVYVEGYPYNNDTIYRIVKMNAKTGEVSSACLDPVCNHSPGSDCLLLLPEDGTMLLLQRLIGDWIVFSYFRINENATTSNETYIYNLKTGESSSVFEVVEDEISVTKWKSLFDVGDKLYNVKCYLDYSESGYDPKGNKPMSSHKPKTTSYLCVYDFDSKTTEELFEVPENYAVTAITNMRYFFTSPEGEIYSCDSEGQNFKKEEVLNFSPIYLCGQYAYVFDYDGLKIYDVTTDTMKTIPVDAPGYVGYITEAGVLICSFTTGAEWLALEYKDFQAAHPEIPVTELRPAYQRELDKIMYSGKAQIWKMDLEGKGKELFFEKEHAHIRIHHATGDYVFAIITYGDPQNNFAMLPLENSGRSVINLKTGEITAIPYFELITPEE